MGNEYHFIVNPSSGRGKVTSALQKVREGLIAAGHEVAIHTTSGPGNAIAVASQLSDQLAAAIAVGGDGTVREVAQGLLGRDIPLAILPAGTENLVAKQFGICTSADRLLETLLNGTIRTIDVGRLEERIFLVVAGIGFDAEVVQRLARRRRGHITHLNYVNPSWRTFWEHRFPELRILADGQEVFKGQGFVLIGNMPGYGIGLNILKDAVVDDGMLDICIFPCRNRWKLLLHAFRAARGRHTSVGEALYLRAREIQVSSCTPVPVELDGDEGGYLPARIEIMSQVLKVLIPPVDPH